MAFSERPNMTNENVADKISDKTHFIEAITQILKAVNCPSINRNFIDILIGYGEGKNKFDIYDIQLGRRADNPNSSRNDNSARKWVQRNRNKLQTWQEQNKIYLIEFKPGYQKGEGKDFVNVPSRYYLHIVEYANQILADAQKDNYWDKSPSGAIERAAIKKAKNIITTPIIFRPRKPKKKEASEQIKTKLSSALTLIEKAIELADENYLILEGENVDKLMAIKLAIEDLECHIPDEENLG